VTDPQIIAFQEACRATHVAWVKYFTKHPELHERSLTRLVGTKRHHERLIEGYDASIRALRALRSRSGRNRPKPAKTGQALPDRENPIFCEHANEVPQACPCAPDCYCKDHTCRYREAS